MFDVIFQPRWLITAATIAYGAGPFFVDMNRTHLLHPAWPGHARFHLLWASVSQLGIAGLALWMTWSPSVGSATGCFFAAIIGLLSTSGFWVALVLKRLYRGTLHDPGGIRPVLGKIDGNLIAVILIDALLVLSFFTKSR